MGMMNDGLSIADAMALAGNDNGGMSNGGGTWIWVFFLFFLLAWGGGGLFGGRGGVGFSSGDLSNGLNQQDIFRNQANIMQEISAFERDATNNWGNMKYDNLVGVNSINAAISQNRFDAAKCCCEINRNIDAIRYENAKNTCDIINAGHEDTQRVVDTITQNEIQKLRDELQSAQLQLNNVGQTQTLISALRPYPLPAYITCSPYESANRGCGGYSC